MEREWKWEEANKKRGRNIRIYDSHGERWKKKLGTERMGYNKIFTNNKKNCNFKGTLLRYRVENLRKIKQL